MRKKLISILIITLMAVPLLSQCSNSKTNEEDNTNITQSVLEDYNEEGLSILKTNYKTTEDMQLALNNLGKDVGGLTFRSTTDKKIKISSVTEENVILSVVQADCSACKESEPILYATAKEKGVKVIPIFLNSSKEDIENFYKELEIEKPEIILMDEEKIIKDTLKLTKTPTLIYIDKNNKISLIKQEFKDEVSLNDDISLAFNEKKLYEYK